VALVATDVSLVCEWVIPDPPIGEVFVSDMVNVDYIDGSSVTHPIGYVASPADCSTVAHGWYYDDPSDPTMIYVCPQTCDWIQLDPDAKIVIKFGCETEVAIPE
jgi:hypothetical protein